jgi:protease I
MRALIITWENFQDQELVYPYYRLREVANSPEDIVIMANVTGKFFGIMGVNMESHALISDLSNIEKVNYYIENYDLLVIPGGVKALEKLRQEKQVILFIAAWNNKKKIIASTCHGAQLMISAKITSGKRISGYYSIEDDISNSGAVYVNEPVVVDGNIVSSPHYNWMGEWMNTAINLAKKNDIN